MNIRLFFLHSLIWQKLTGNAQSLEIGFAYPHYWKTYDSTENEVDELIIPCKLSWTHDQRKKTKVFKIMFVIGFVFDYCYEGPIDKKIQLKTRMRESFS